jgi:hypothetical protein
LQFIRENKNGLPAHVFGIRDGVGDRQALSFENSVGTRA